MSIVNLARPYLAGHAGRRLAMQGFGAGPAVWDTARYLDLISLRAELEQDR